MRPRTPSFIWIPFVFSVGGISWAMLIASLTLLSALILAPAAQEMRDAEIQRNDLKATVALRDQEIELKKSFLQNVTHPMVLIRLAQRQFNVTPPGEKVLELPADPNVAFADPSVDAMLRESLNPVQPDPVAPIPEPLQAAMVPGMREPLIFLALGGLAVSFMLGVRFDMRQRRGF